MADYPYEHYYSAWRPWPVTFLPWNWCGISLAARTTLLLILVLLRVFFVELWTNASNYRHDVMIVTFDLKGHRMWCKSSYTIRVPSLNFADLPIPKIWLIFGNGVKRPGDLDLWPFDL